MRMIHAAVWWALKDKDITIAFPQLDLHLNDNVADAAKKRER